VVSDTVVAGVPRVHHPLRVVTSAASPNDDSPDMIAAADKETTWMSMPRACAYDTPDGSRAVVGRRPGPHGTPTALAIVSGAEAFLAAAAATTHTLPTTRGQD
jgi:hypothetical protein